MKKYIAVILVTSASQLSGFVAFVDFVFDFFVSVPLSILFFCFFSLLVMFLFLFLFEHQYCKPVIIVSHLALS